MHKNDPANNFYGRVFTILLNNKIPFLVGGGHAVFEYTGFNRPTNDLDIFFKGGDLPKIVTILREAGLNISILDERWLAKVQENGFYVDLLFSSPNYLISVDDLWFEKAKESELFGIKIQLMPVEELIWCKAYIQDRYRFDGADINHLILMTGKSLDWKRLLLRMENNWELLLVLILHFRFVYPSERNIIPKWLIEELISRLTYQLHNPPPIDRICRGPLLSRSQYKIDLEKLGFEAI